MKRFLFVLALFCFGCQDSQSQAQPKNVPSSNFIILDQAAITSYVDLTAVHDKKRNITCWLTINTQFVNVGTGIWCLKDDPEAKKE